MVGYKVPKSVPHYEGLPTGSTPKISHFRLMQGMAIEKESTQGGQPTGGSYGHANPTVVFAKDGVYNITSGNNRFGVSYDNFKMYGPVFNNDGHGHGHWKAAGEDDYSGKHDVVRLPQRTSESGATESFGEKLLKLHENDPQTPTYIHTFYLQGLRINETGKKNSEVQNLKNRLTKHFGKEIAYLLANEAVKSGGSVEPIDYIGVGFAPEDVAYGVTRLRDGKILVIAGEDIFGEISQQARAGGIDTESYLETILAEEQEHINRKSFDKYGDIIAEEIATKDSVYRKLLELAQGAEGGDPRNPRYERERRKAQRKAEIKKKDRDTTKERYTEKGTSSKRLYLKDKAASEDDTDGYNSLDEISEEDTKESRMSKLEQIAEKGNAKEAPKEEAHAEAEMQEAA